MASHKAINSQGQISIAKDKMPVKIVSPSGSLDGVREGETTRAIKRRNGIKVKSKTPSPEPAPVLQEDLGSTKSVHFSVEVVVQQAVKEGDLELLKKLVEENGKAIISGCDSRGVPLTVRAIINLQLEVLQFLIDGQVDLSLTDPDGWTALHAAVAMNEYKFVKAILYKPNPQLTTCRSLNNLRPIDIARSIEIAMCILQSELTWFRRDFKIVRKDWLEIDEEMLSDLEEEQLTQAILEQDPSTVTTYIEKMEVDLNCKLLHYAATKNFYKLGFLILERNLEDIDVKDTNGNTPLHLAAWHGHTDILLLLKQYGANPISTDKKGYTPVYLATPKHSLWLNQLNYQKNEL